MICKISIRLLTMPPLPLWLKNFRLVLIIKRKKSALKKTICCLICKPVGKSLKPSVFFFPDRPLQPETKHALKKMVSAAQKYLLDNLQKKYPLTKQQVAQIKRNLSDSSIDDFLFQTQLESMGIDETCAQRTVKIADVLKKIIDYTDYPHTNDKGNSPQNSQENKNDL